MTSQQFEMPSVPEEIDPRLPAIVTPEGNARLAQLHATYADVKARADEANEQLKAITDAIKAELAAAQPNATRIELHGDDGPTLAMTYSERWTVDTKRLKDEAPETYVRYAKKGGSWSLRAIGGGE